MEHTDGGRALQGSNDDQMGPNTLPVGKRSPGRDTMEGVSIRKQTLLSVQDVSAARDEDNEYHMPPFTPEIWTEAPSPAEGRVVAEALHHFPSVPPVPPEGVDSERTKRGSKHNLIVKGSSDNEAVSHAFIRGKNPSGLRSPHHDESAQIREEVSNDAHPEQRWGWGGALFVQGESHGDSCNLLGQRGISVSAGRTIVDGERLTHELVRDDIDHGYSFLEKDGAVKGEANDYVNPEEILGRVQRSAFIQQKASFLQSSSDESIESVGERGGARNGITMVGRRAEESYRGILPHSEVDNPSVGDVCPANYQNKDPGTGIEECGASRRMDKEIEHVRERKTTRNDPFHSEHRKGWLDSEDEQREQGEKLSFRSRLSPPTREDNPSSRIFPQSYDFKRRRSSLFSVHFGNGSLLGSLHQGVPRSLSPMPSTRRGRLQNRTLPASKPDVSDEMAGVRLLRVIPSGTLANSGQGRNTIDGVPSQAEQALLSQEAFARSLVSRRRIHSAIHDSPLGSFLGSEAGTGTTGSSIGKSGETTGSSSFSPFSTMPDSDESNGGTVGVHDLLEELDRPNAEEKREEGGESAQEIDAKDSVERGASNNLQMGLLDAEEITFLLKSQKIRESLLLVEDLDFGMLPLARQVELLRDVSVVHFAVGEAIFRKGESSDAMYFPLGITESTSYTMPNNGWHRADGTSKLLISETDPGEGKEHQSREFWPSGRILGEEGLIYSSDRPRSSTIRAAGDLSCAVVRAPAFPDWWEFRLRLLTKKVPWLAKLAPTTQGNLLHTFKYVDLQANEVIIRQGESGDTFFIIMSGTAIVTLSTEPALASSISTSDDDTVTGADDDDAIALDVLPSTDECYTTCQPRYEEDRVFAYPARHGDSVTCAERRKDDSGGGGNEEGVVNRDGSRPPTASRAVQDIPDEKCFMYVINSDRHKNMQTRSKAPMNEGEAGKMPSGPLTGTLSSSPGKTHFKETKASPRSSTVNGETILARLYEGNDFGEMALVYDEPRNANVRTVTEMTCLVLGKDDFRKCLEDKAFHKHIEQETLQRACYREQRVNECEWESRRRSLLGKDLEVPQPAFSSRKRRVTARGPRSSFRFTAKMVRRRGGDKADHDREVNNYRVLKKVGEGSFGSVYKVVNVYTDVVYAMKIINKPSKGGHKLKNFEQSLKREVSVMKVLRHPNVVTLWEVINDPRSRKVYMIQEFMERGPLLKEEYNVEPIPENEAVFKFIQATRGLQYVHSHGICHGDIKPANILEDHNGRVKITDFGACVILDQDDDEGVDESSSNGSEGHQTPNRTPGSWCKLQKKSGQRVGGTPGFQAPELFEEGDTIKISFASDVWALGVTLYQMVVGRMPFFGSSYRALMSAIKMEALTFPVDSHLDPYLMNLLHRMLRKNPATRITLEEVMRHEWITKEGLRLSRLEGNAKSLRENLKHFGSMASPSSRSSRSTSPKSTRRASSPSRLPNPDSPTSEARESLSRSLPTDDQGTLTHPLGDSTPRGSLDGHDKSRQTGDEGYNNLPDRNFSRGTIENFMNKRWGNFPPGIVCDAQKIVVDQRSFPDEDWASSPGEKKTSTLQVTKRKSTPRHRQDPGFPSTREPYQMPPLLESSLPAASSSFSSGDLKGFCSPSAREHWRNRQLLNSEGEVSSGFSQESIPIHRREWQEQGQLQQERQRRQPTHWKPIVSPPGALRQMSLPRLMGASKPSWREPFLNECASDTLPARLRQDLDDSMALERSERLVRKADFLMLKMDPIQTSNARLVVSAKSGFSLVRPSGDRKVGSRRSSAWHPGRPSFEGAGETPRMPHIPPFPVTDDRDEVEPLENRLGEECKHIEGVYTNSTSAIDCARANQQQALSKGNTPTRFISRSRPSLKDGTSNEGEASGDHSSSSTGFAARLLLPVDGERTEKWRQTAARVSATAASTTTTNNEAILNSIESMNMTTSFFAASSVEKSLSLRERWTEHTQTNAWDYLAATGKQRRIRASLSFPRPISLQHPLPTFHDPIDWIDAEEPKQSKHPFASFSGRRRVEVSDAESRAGTEYSSSSRGCCPNRSPRNRSLVSGIKGDTSGDGSCSRGKDPSFDRSAKPNVTNGYTNEDLRYDERGSDYDDGSIQVSSCSSSSSDDGLEEETSVTDIIDCLEYIGEAVMERDDKDLAILDRTEILALSKGTVARSLSLTSTGGGNKALIRFEHGEKSLTKAASIDSDAYTFGHVEARNWGHQVNAEVGVRFGVSLNQGNLSFMEDTATCLADAFGINRRTPESKPPGTSHAPADPVPVRAPEEEPGKGAAAYFAVFDGHGGADVAIHLQDVLHQRVLGDPSFPSNIPEAISNGCMATDLECLKLAHEKHLAKTNEDEASSLHAPTLKRQGSDDGFSGAVSVMAILHRPPCPWSPSVFTHGINSSGGTSDTGASSGTLFRAPQQTSALEPHTQQFRPPIYLHVANVGDCRAVLCRAGKAVALTQDHTPAVASEVARIEAAGGFVSRCRVNGILGVSRSFGDIHCKMYPPRQGQGLWDNQQVVSRPEVHSMELTPADSFLILASDGLWGVLSNQQAVSFVHRRLLTHRDVQRAAVELIDKALDTSSYDNCTCIVVCLNQTRP